jgi:hypothetical protein
VLVVDRSGRLTYVICDLLLAVPHLPGFWGFAWRVLRFTGEPGPSPLWKKRVMVGGGALKRDLLRLADRPGVVRLIPSHGRVIEGNVAEVLRRVAAKLPT